MNINNLEIQGSTKCNCGHEFILKDITSIEKINEHGFYSGVVKEYSKTKCPHCGQETILLIRQKGQSWEILNTAINIDIAEKPKMKIEETKQVSNEFVCSVCGKICKSKSGLTAHLKTHNE